MINQSQRDFLELLVRRQALRFGEFTLKSGRKSPYFINTGSFHMGGDLARLGSAYAATIRERFGSDVQVVFGPAYKGIPLALATAAAYESLVGRPIGWTFDRKEAKDHGDGGLFVGHPLTAGVRVVLVDDVITDGRAKREAVEKLKPTGVDIVGLVVAFDREEPGLDGRPALAAFAADAGIPSAAVLRISEAASYLASHDLDGRRHLDAERYAQILAHLGR
ncbi:orotate phosphoribosyltransferase [Planctomycetota bacterium]|nr:orotate phosphoribosyltransferase [Planctomycetota bacterium]